MADSTDVRAFVAIDLALAVHTALVQLKEALARERSDVRWVRDHGLHVTVKFLGGVPKHRLNEVRGAVARAAASVAAFTARVRGLGAFPSLNRPRVVWVGLEGERFTELAHAVDGALIPLGFPRESRPFHPHITLGRVSGRRGWDAVESVLKTHWTADFGVSPVVNITAYRSDLRPGGAVYTALWTSALADSTRRDLHGIGQ